MRDGGGLLGSSIAMAQTRRVTLGPIPQRLLVHGTGRDGRAIAIVAEHHGSARPHGRSAGRAVGSLPTRAGGSSDF